MHNMKDGWTAADWQIVEDCTRNLLYLTNHMSERVKTGGGSINADEVRATAVRAEDLLMRLKRVTFNYE